MNGSLRVRQNAHGIEKFTYYIPTPNGTRPFGLQGTELFVHLDDIVIYAKDVKDHGKKVRRLLKQLKEANLSLQPEKCEFLFTEIAYLGHIISDRGVKPDPKNIEAVQNFPSRKTPRNIKKFLGLAE